MKSGFISTLAASLLLALPLVAQDGGNNGGSSKPDSTVPKANEPAPAVTRAHPLRRACGITTVPTRR